MTALRASGVMTSPLRTLWGVGVVGSLSDGQLLERFATGHGEAAELPFQALVERHGPMVLRVCRRLLDDPNDAEDAFQATFLVLLRHAGRIRERGSVAAWLHGVAARIAARARVEAARRRRIEQRGIRLAVADRDTAERQDVAYYHWKTALGLLCVVGALGTGLGLALVVANPQQSPPPEAKPTQSTVAQNDRATSLREMLQFKGTWTSDEIMEETINDVPQPPKTVKIIWSIDRDTITESDEKGFAQHTYRFRIDQAQTPRTVDLTLLNTGLELRGIYKIEGDTLTICEGLERPRDFEKRETQFLRIFHRQSRTPAQLVPEVANAPGCYWAIGPEGGVPGSMTSSGISYVVKKDEQGAMIVTLAFMAKLDGGEPNVEYRPVAMDDQKTRYLLKHNQGGGWSSSATFPGIVLAQYGFRLDPKELPYDQVRNLGIEVVPAEVRRAAESAQSDLAFKEARDAGIELLPRPEVGQRFEFSLTDTQSHAFRSSDLKGKVVLIDLGASWRSPCMGKLAEVKTLYEARRRDGFEVVSVNFKADRAALDRMVKTAGLSWPQVIVPNDARTRRLWTDGPGLHGTPRLFLIDRAGILRWNGGPDGLEKRITELLDAPR